MLKFYQEIKQKEILIWQTEFILNETSYHGSGAIREIVTEVKARWL